MEKTKDLLGILPPFMQVAQTLVLSNTVVCSQVVS